MEPPVDHISLTASTATIDLSDLYRSTIQFEARLAAAVARAKEENKDNDLGPGVLHIVLEESKF
jgi:hypothetical protein